MATEKLYRVMALLAKIESAYATDPTLSGAANAILASNVVVRPMVSDVVTRNNIQSYLGNRLSIPTGTVVEMEFDTEVQGSGTAGTAPAWGPLMRGAGNAEVIVASTSVTYSPLSAAPSLMESLYFKFWLDGVLHAMKGARGSKSLQLNAQGIPVWRWKFTGLWVAPSDTANPSVTLTNWPDPLIANNINTPTFTVNGVALVMRNYALDFGQRVEKRLLIGREQIAIVDRAETLDITCEAVPLATFNPFSLANAQTLVAVSLVHGTAAGKIVTVSLPTAQVMPPDGYEENQGIAEWKLKLRPIPTSAGNDQYSIAVT